MKKINIFVVTDTKEKKMQVFNILKDYYKEYSVLLDYAQRNPSRYMEIRLTIYENGYIDIGNLSLGGSYANNKLFDCPTKVNIKEFLIILRRVKNEL